MRIDAYTHFIPPVYLKKMDEMADSMKDIGKRMRGIKCIYDVDERKRIVDGFKDYKQILSYPMPPLESYATKDNVEELTRIINDGFTDICGKNGDHFAGYVAQVSLMNVDGAIREAERAIKQLGACGVQIYTNVAGKAIDKPEYEPFWAKMVELDKPVWIHPARLATQAPDYVDEDKSLYEIWWTFGWSYETAAMMARLVFSKVFDRHPDLKVIVHHFGAIVPMLEGRVGYGQDQMGNRTSDEDYVALRQSLKKKRPIDYFRENFYADTATFGADAATECGFDFYPIDKIVFASDCPFDPEKGPGYIRETIRILEAHKFASKEDADKVWYKNIERITGKTFVK